MAARSKGDAVFIWKDHGRFVEVHPVQTGWLVLWGRFEDRGQRRLLLGNRTYPDLAGARHRVGVAVEELTRRSALAAEAMLLFDRIPAPDHSAEALPDPL